MKSPDIRRYLRHGTLPQLLALEAVVRLGSVTRAAEALHLAQPTVSGHLRKLSQVAGLPLYEPGARGMVATEAGQALLAAAHDVFEALRRADAALAPLRGADAALAPLHGADATLAPRGGARACQPA